MICHTFEYNLAGMLPPVTIQKKPGRRPDQRSPRRARSYPGELPPDLKLQSRLHRLEHDTSRSHGRTAARCGALHPPSIPGTDKNHHPIMQQVSILIVPFFKKNPFLGNRSSTLGESSEMESQPVLKKKQRGATRSRSVQRAASPGTLGAKRSSPASSSFLHLWLRSHQYSVTITRSSSG